MAADPEDMYVAYHLENEDFDVFQEIRTVEESHSAFRYDGIILVKKGSDIRNLKDLKGKKSCHTGFGRNVGYKVRTQRLQTSVRFNMSEFIFQIPLTKLRKHEVLKLSSDPELSSTEKELDALSAFFDKACIVGKWSPDKLVNEVFSEYPVVSLKNSMKDITFHSLQKNVIRIYVPSVRTLSNVIIQTSILDMMVL